MPKATLKFELPEENNEFQLALSAGKLYSVVHTVQQQLRGLVKYGFPEESISSWREAVERIYAQLCAELEWIDAD